MVCPGCWCGEMISKYVGSQRARGGGGSLPRLSFVHHRPWRQSPPFVAPLALRPHILLLRRRGGGRLRLRARCLTPFRPLPLPLPVALPVALPRLLPPVGGRRAAGRVAPHPTAAATQTPRLVKPLKEEDIGATAVGLSFPLCGLSRVDPGAVLFLDYSLFAGARCQIFADSTHAARVETVASRLLTDADWSLAAPSARWPPGRLGGDGGAEGVLRPSG